MENESNCWIVSGFLKMRVILQAHLNRWRRLSWSSIDPLSVRNSDTQVKTLRILTLCLKAVSGKLENGDYSVQSNRSARDASLTARG